MIRTPIDDFVREYADSNTARLHMPGHKGAGDIERYDITEIKGAGSLYEDEGIITESERYASELFGSDTFYSTEGSSLAIRAMLYLALIAAKENGKRPLILAGRNAHKVFISSAALLDFDVEWLIGGGSYMSCVITADALAEKLDKMEDKPTAVYLTSPDYLGNMADVESLARVCQERGIMLLVDNAHGAYLKFLSPSRHPIDLGADMCADSAHKTLPVLTGGAYLHLSKQLPESIRQMAKNALALFGSTSPSYLILSSLDSANRLLDGEFADNLQIFVSKISSIKAKLTDIGYELVGDEEMKITLSPLSYGYTGEELAELLRDEGIEPEFADRDYVTLMPSPVISEDLDLLLSALSRIERMPCISTEAPELSLPERACSIREATLSPSEVLPLDLCAGRILAAADVSCPPAVPILGPGEVISEVHLDIFDYYGKDSLRVIKS